MSDPLRRIPLSSLPGLPALLALVLALPVLSLAGAWPLKPGSGKAALGGYQVAAASVIDAKGRKHAYGYEESGLFTYGEIGLRRRLSLAWAWGFLKAVESYSVDALGVTDPEIAINWHFGKKGSWVFALQALGQFPVGPTNPPEAPDYAPVFFSTRTFGYELRPMVGWAAAGWWAQGGMGLRVRIEGFLPQFRYALAGGRGFGKRFSALLSFDGVVPIEGQSTGQPGDRELYYGYHLGGDIKVTRRLDLGAQFDSMLTYGQELPLGARLGVHARLTWP